MRFIAIDLENNQPSGKIVQIGATVFDTDNKRPYSPVGAFNTFVNPGEVINWDHELNNGLTLGELLGDKWRNSWERNSISEVAAFTEFWDWVTSVEAGKKIIQWGKSDLNELIEQSKQVGVYPVSNLKNINIKQLYQVFYQPALKLDKKPAGLEKACTEMGVEFLGRAHDAVVDSVNTGRLAVKMFNIIKKYNEIEKVIKQE